MAVEELGEHIDTCNVSFKQAIMEKVKALKQGDTTILTERVSRKFFSFMLIILSDHRLKSLRDRKGLN